MLFPRAVFLHAAKILGADVAVVNKLADEALERETTSALLLLCHGLTFDCIR